MGGRPEGGRVVGAVSQKRRRKVLETPKTEKDSKQEANELNV